MFGKFDVITFLLFHAIMFSFGHEFKIFSEIVVVTVLLYVLSNVKNYRKLFNRFKGINISVILFSVVILVSGLYGEMNYGRYSWHVSSNSSILLALQVMAIFAYFEYSILEKYQDAVLYTFIITLAAWVFVTDMYILLNLGNITDDPNRIFIIGNKFSVSYSNMILFSLLHIRKRKMFFSISSILVCLFIAYNTYCTTAFVGSLLLIFFVFFKKFVHKWIYNFVPFFVLSFVSLIFAIYTTMFVENPIVHKILTDLGENSTLNGRTTIYSNLSDLISNSIWLGYGNGNSNGVIGNTIGFGNAQNGVMEVILNWGILGLFALFMLIYQILKKSQRSEYNYYILCLAYIYIIMGMVEITLGFKLIVLMSLYFLISKNSEIIIKDKNEKIRVRIKRLLNKYNCTANSGITI